MSTDGYGAQNQSGHNAWQCVYCAIVSRGTREPSGGDFGGFRGCSVASDNQHLWKIVNTNGGGWQCKGCGTISHYTDREPNGGEFGGYRGCVGDRSHNWRRF